MTPEQFCYWLQGLFEIAEPDGLTERQMDIIRNHLNSVFEQTVTRPAPDSGGLRRAREEPDLNQYRFVRDPRLTDVRIECSAGDPSPHRHAAIC